MLRKNTEQRDNIFSTYVFKDYGNTIVSTYVFIFILRKEIFTYIQCDCSA